MSTSVRTHGAIDPRLCGAVESLSPGAAEVRLRTVPEMSADEHRLVHGGFVFGLADYAAMLAVNEPTVVLGAAETRFTRPVVVGQELVAKASAPSPEGRKWKVEVEVDGPEGTVFQGTFTCFVPDRHVLDRGEEG